ncbi:MAG: DUF2851 family protein, partial [Verrucomicrobia bacterium]|nr:DUF2851 family protein [Verrucomicrobiota bacterium]
FPEKLLQKIWFQGDFDRSRLVTHDGRWVQVRHPGRWNLLGGPDFKDASLRFDGNIEVTGDVELHVRAEDWKAHGHAGDSAYDRVVLHVVLFPVGPGHVTVGGDGRSLPVLELLPRLTCDLEQYAMEDAVETLARRPASRVRAELGHLRPEDLDALLRSRARDRWDRKVRHAGQRINRLGWTEACHQTALEILGYRFNRVPMLRIATGWPLERWHDSPVDVAAVAAGERWVLHGVRPLNHPRLRLRQYARWTAATGNWPDHLREWGATLPPIGPSLSTREVRRQVGCAALRTSVGKRVCGDAIGGARLENLVCDGFLPLLSAETGKNLSELWYHWYPGTIPSVLDRSLRQLGVYSRPLAPSAHGPAQGLLGWLIEQRCY